MKPLFINQNSWHWHIAHTYGGVNKWDVPASSCAYFGKIVQGFLVLLGISALATLVILLMAVLPLTYYAYTVTAMVMGWPLLELPPEVFVPTSLWVVMTAMGVNELLAKRIRNMRPVRVPSNKPEATFWKLLRSWKQKVCVPVVLLKD